MKIRILIVVFSVFLTIKGQDTTIFRQANASMFSNNYTFIKKNKTDNFGTFIQYSATDDFQCWHGKGVFNETRKKYFLTFDTTYNHNRIETVSLTKHSDTLYIKWFNKMGKQQEVFTIKFAETFTSIKAYQVDLLTGIVKIPKKDLANKELSLFAFGSDLKIVSFFVEEIIDEINVFADDLTYTHTFDKTKETLKKNTKGFKTVGMWTEERKTQFVVIQK